MFKLDDAGSPEVVAGVPPDYFSATGQLWGNPLYNWETSRRGGHAQDRLAHPSRLLTGEAAELEARLGHRPVVGHDRAQLVPVGLGIAPCARVVVESEVLADNPLGDPTRHIQAIIGLISRCKDEDVSPAALLAPSGSSTACSETTST